MTTSIVSTKYQIVIPKAVRKATSIKPGTKLVITATDADHIMISPMRGSHTEHLRGLGKEVWKSLGGADVYLKNERNSWDK